METFVIYYPARGFLGRTRWVPEIIVQAPSDADLYAKAAAQGAKIKVTRASFAPLKDIHRAVLLMQGDVMILQMNAMMNRQHQAAEAAHKPRLFGMDGRQL